MEGQNKTFRILTLEDLKDRDIGPVGTLDRDQYEFELRLDLLGEMIRSVRKQRKLTQTQLGELIGVQKSQISKLERNARNVTIETILKVFNALEAHIKFTVELKDSTFSNG
jgi:DNA-binding XRE family transcriptional regulator